MRIIPRSESGLAPPLRPVYGGYPKQAIIIHHTCSPNGILSLAAERSIMRAWQLDHETKYNAKDILQAFTVFQSGRIYENRIPYDSDNGAIYNEGGWSYRGIGIECQGDFRRGVYMDDLQYQSLVFLCKSLVGPVIPVSRLQVYGHMQLPPCRPGDKHPTDCPANLLPQFVLNNKLYRDILSGEIKQEVDDEMDVDTSGVPVQERMYPCYIGKMQGGRPWDCWVKALSLNREPTRVVFKSITNSMIGPTEAGLSVTLQQNKSVEVVAGADLKMAGAGWVHVWADHPCYIGFDYRPTV